MHLEPPSEVEEPSAGASAEGATGAITSRLAGYLVRERVVEDAVQQRAEADGARATKARRSLARCCTDEVGQRRSKRGATAENKPQANGPGPATERLHNKEARLTTTT